MKLGFIGLGNMGNHMARNLLEGGFALAVHDLVPARGENLIALGATWAENPRQVARNSDAIICSLPSPKQVEMIMLGENGVLSGVFPGSTWIDMSTNSPDVVKRIARRAREKGVAALEAPVTGAVDGAKAGKLTIFVGGDQAVYKRHLQVFAPMGKTLHTGPLGTGNAAKLATNLLWFINAVAIGEGLILGAKSGVEPKTMWEIIKSSAGNSWVAEHDVPSVFQGDYDPSFTLDLCVKDLRLIGELGYQLDVPLELGALVEQIFRRARVQYGGEQGEMHVVKLLEEVTGVSLQIEDF